MKEPCCTIIDDAIAATRKRYGRAPFFSAAELHVLMNLCPIVSTSEGRTDLLRTFAREWMAQPARRPETWAILLVLRAATRIWLERLSSLTSEVN